MASGWMKSLQCKSRAVEDVYHDPNPKTRLINSVSCRKSNVVFVDTPNPNPSKSKSTKRRSHRQPEPPAAAFPMTSSTATRTRSSSHDVEPFLTKLPEGHPSRNVVEIIFHTSWSGPKAFTGRIEMIFKVKNGSKTVARFEEYREQVRSRYSKAAKLGSNVDIEDARCVADGNEVMRFHCLASCHAFAGASIFHTAASKGTAICTFSGSRMAHDNSGASSRGRRAMLVCRVVAGRVSKQLDLQSLLNGRLNGFDSVSGGDGDLLVLDPRAVLPCFLIIYRL